MIADYLASEHVPFSIALIPLYGDSLGAFNIGVPLTLHWKDRPATLAAVKYARQRGGRLFLHGYTHQFGPLKNPYSGVTADDFEFIAAHVDANSSVIYDGALPGDSAAQASRRSLPPWRWLQRWMSRSWRPSGTLKSMRCKLPTSNENRLSLSIRPVGPSCSAGYRHGRGSSRSSWRCRDGLVCCRRRRRASPTPAHPP